ncbi:DUF4291 family protein [Streptomyces spiramyceticus]
MVERLPRPIRPDLKEREGRLTWIKPSFLWMTYRCGWG